MDHDADTMDLAINEPAEREGRNLRLKVILAITSAAIVVGAGTAIASHAPEIDPASVPTGFFVAHNYVADVPVSAENAA